MSVVLVTDLKIIDSPQSGIGVARCLRAAGHTVYGADDTPFVLPGLFTETFVLEELRTLNLHSLMQKLESYRERYGIEYIVPCYDESAILCMFLRDKLAFLGIEVLAPPLEFIKKVRKESLSSLQAGLLRSPPTTRVRSLPQARAAAKRIGYPVYVKGLTKGAHLVPGPSDLRYHVQRLSCHGSIDCLIQKAVTGRWHNAMLGYHDSRLVSYIEMEKIAMDGQGATWFGRLGTEKLLLKDIQAIFTPLNPGTCVVEVETIIGTDGRYYMYEVNPRPPAWLHAACLHGFNPMQALLSPPATVQFNSSDMWFGRETGEFLHSGDNLDYSTKIGVYSKGATHTGRSQVYPSEILF